uniref:Uncharacterized protein n=1 Tax=Arundo donax TaxID=35708 RepID=A0A0A9A576_ARUDO
MRQHHRSLRQTNSRNSQMRRPMGSCRFGWLYPVHNQPASRGQW